jgi:hypothetical protein
MRGSSLCRVLRSLSSCNIKINNVQIQQSIQTKPTQKPLNSNLQLHPSAAAAPLFIPTLKQFQTVSHVFPPLGQCQYPPVRRDARFQPAKRNQACCSKLHHQDAVNAYL